MLNASLILEGGGMRGIYTAGVLDYFMEQELLFSSVYGVSAGSCHAVSYLSNQKGRAYRISTEYLNDKRYCSVKSLITTGDMFGVDMCYNLIPNQLDPYDYDAFLRYKGNFYAVVTNCRNGCAEYLHVKDLRNDITAIRASSSLPMASRMVKYHGQKYLDGGIADSIPIEKSIADGNKLNVVVLTREKGYRKKHTSGLMFWPRYLIYPNLVRAIDTRHLRYNHSLDVIEKLEAEGKIIVIRPSVEPNVGRTEKNLEKLKALYDLGYNDAKKRYQDILRYTSPSGTDE